LRHNGHAMRHDAFMSYSQTADGRLAPALERGLERLAKPLFRLRAMDVFRDKTGLSASPGLLSSIVSHLEASRWLVFLASPRAAASVWCARELQWWLERHGNERLLLVLTDGTLAWDAAAADFDWSRTDALPDVVRGRFSEEPLYVDLRWAAAEPQLDHRDARLRPALLDIAAAVRELPKDELDGDDVRQQRRTRQLAWAAVVLISTAAAIAIWQAHEAIQQRDAANELRDRALSRQLAAQSSDLLVRDPALALLLAAQSRAVVPTAESSSALLRALQALPLTSMHQHSARWWTLHVPAGSDELVLGDASGGLYRNRVGQAQLTELQAPGPAFSPYRTVHAIAVSPDRQIVAHASTGGGIQLRAADGQVRELETGDKVGEDNLSLFVSGLAFSADGQRLATSSTSGAVMLHDLRSGEMRALGGAGVDLTAVAFSPDGRCVVAGGDREFLRAFPLDAKKSAKVPQFASEGRGAVVAIAFHAASKRMFAASLAGRIEVFDSETGARNTWVDSLLFGGIEAFALAPDGQSFVTGHSAGAVVWWHARANGGWHHRLIMRHNAAVAGVGFAADGKRVISAGRDGRVFVSLPADLLHWRSAGKAIPVELWTGYGKHEVPSPDRRWIAVTELDLDLSGLRGGGRGPRLTLLRARDRVALVDRFELAFDQEGQLEAEPVFSADSSMLALQLGEQLMLWDLSTMQPLDQGLQLPLDTKLVAARADPRGWIATDGSHRYEFDSDPATLAQTACRLAGRKLSPPEWKHYLGDGKYPPSCR
jgi:hypothetical protein